MFGPPALTCSLKDERYSDQVQALLQNDDYLCFVTQTKSDHIKLSAQFYRTMRLTVSIRTCLVPLSSYRSPMTREQAASVGLDGFAIDFLNGPEPVLSMLCGEKKLHTSGVALSDINEVQYNRIVEGEIINSWATGRSSYRVTRRREYGAGAVSTSSKLIPAGRFWKDQPVDSEEKRNINRRMNEAKDEWQQLKQQHSELKEAIRGFDDRKAAIVSSIVSSL